MIHPTTRSGAGNHVGDANRCACCTGQLHFDRHIPGALRHGLRGGAQAHCRHRSDADLGLGHQKGCGARHILVVIPELPDGITPGPELTKEGIGLDDISLCRKGGSCAVDLIPQELDVLTAGGLVEKVDSNRVRLRNVDANVLQLDLVIAPGVFLAAKVSGRIGALPDRLGQA